MVLQVSLKIFDDFNDVFGVFGYVGLFGMSLLDGKCSFETTALSFFVKIR